jgi:hypothetical protein
VKKSVVAVVCLLLLCSLTMFAAEHATVAHVKATSNVRIPSPAPDAGLVQIYSNLGPLSTDIYNDTYGFYLLGPSSFFGFSQSTALPFTPKNNSTVIQVRVPIQWYNDGSADTAQVSIYSDNGGVPGSVIAGPFAITPPAGFTCCRLTTVSVSPGLSVTAGTQYWVEADGLGTFDGLWLVKADAPITGYNQFDSGWFDNIGQDVGAAGAVYGTVP